MSDPKRIQRKRTKGWRMPEGAVSVTRPGKWGNPFVVKQSARFAGMEGIWFVQQAERADRVWHPEQDTKAAATELAIKVYRGEVGGFWNARFREAVRDQLAGKDLACWCPESQPCHGDVLLAIANAPIESTSAPTEESANV